MVPDSPAVTVITFAFTFHIRCIFIFIIIIIIIIIIISSFTCRYSFILLALLYGSKTKWTRCCVKPRTSKFNVKITGLVI